MNELQIIKNENGNDAVLCSQLYNNLGLAPQHFASWIKKNIVNNDFAIEGVDYILLTPTKGDLRNKKIVSTYPNGRIRKRKQDFVLSLDFAKHLAMQCRTKQGYEVRVYFIEFEKSRKSKENLIITELKKRLGIYEKMEQIRNLRTTLNRQMQELKTALTSSNEAPDNSNYQLTLNFN